jgi:hypothetical protein
MRHADLCHLAPKCSKMSPLFANLLPQDRCFSLGNRPLGHMDCRSREKERCFTFSQPQSQRKVLSPEWDVVLSCRMVTFSTGSGRSCVTDDRVGTSEEKCDTVHSHSDPVEQGYTQTHLGLGTPKWPSASWRRILSKLVFSCWLQMTPFERLFLNSYL